MNNSIAFIMDPIQGINPKKDSTLAMICAALSKHWTCYHLQAENLQIVDGKLRGFGEQIIDASCEHSKYYELADTTDIDLEACSVLMMRKDPPFDMAYIYASYMLEKAEAAGVLVVNRPQSLRDCNEKLFATQFSEFTPRLCVSSNMAALRAFVKTLGEAILKPLDGMGGASIFKTSSDDPNLSVILETLTLHGTATIMAQEYVAAITDGDKRILMINGEPVSHCLARIPASGETRGNLAAGGSGRVQALSPRDYEIAAAVGPALKQKGIIFAGLDVIGDKLTEINVTSPTCVREISKATGQDIALDLMNAIETMLKS